MFDSYSVLKVVPLSVSAVQQPDEYDKENEPNAGYDTVGGILKDTKHFWTHNGPRFNVINCKTGEKVASWCFGYVTKDVSARIVCVDEMNRTSGTLPLLVIGIQSDFSGGMICIFDIYGSRVLRAICINKQVTSVHVVDSMRGTLGSFENFDGVLAVGTIGGDVILIDLYHQACEDALNSPGQNLKDEVNACQLLYLLVRAITSLDLLRQRQYAYKNDEHICTHLNAYDDATPHFILKGPKGENRIHVNKVEVTVSALYYCLQLGVLFVGYNFGAWQMWDLINLKLIYTSPIFEDNIPVAHFALQEPSDDPRAFCYVWVVYTCADALHPVGYPVAVLYSLNYERKKLIDGYGILYQNFTSCGVRFQSELTLQDEDVRNSSRHGAYCFGLQPINTTISIGGSLHENQEESISLCCITWNGWSSNSNRLKTYMSLFDLNQWYKAQMPSTARPAESEAYISHVCLSNILHGTNSDPILNVRININSLKHFVGSQRLEEHYYPSSLAFQMLALTEYNIISINNLGTQRALLSHLETGGALAIIKPTNYFQSVIELGLLPLFIDTPLNSSTIFEQQRDILLSVALEQKLLGWLCRCALEWNNGSYSSAGCTLNFMLNWGWKRAQVLKKNADLFCVSLFDYSGYRLDANTHNMLSNCARQLRNLATLFDHIVQKCFDSELSIEIIKHQKESLQMTAIHLEVLLWLLNIGLLPECPLSNYPRIDEFKRISAPYDIDQLSKYYNERRAFLQSLSKEPISLSESFLFIDNFINIECGGSKLQEQWQGDGGNGLYPPSSLQALIRTYLIENVDIATKHRVIVYLFLDIITTLDCVEYKHVITNLLKFPAIFHVAPSTIKITQGFWKLDHGDFISALELLLDPLVCSSDFSLWQHRVVLKTLLVQEQYHLALSYLQVRRPALSDVNDICTVLSLFVANNMIDDAFQFQRQNKYNTTYEKILQHFYKECDQRGAIAFILRLPLTVEEKECFTKYLHLVKHPKLEDLQMVNRLQHSNTLLQESGNVSKEVEKPKPLSVLVHSSQQQIKYKSTSIHVKLASSKESVRQTPRLICSRILEEETNGDGPSPCKRFKPSPRFSVTSPELQYENRNTSAQLHTPLIKRKIPKQSVLFKESDEHRSVQTPQSILKVRTIVHSPQVSSTRQESKTPENLADITTTTPVFDKFGTLENASLNLTSRKPLPRTPRPAVHFDISKSSSEASLISNKGEPSPKILNVDEVLHLSEKNELNYDFKKMLDSSEDTFYSPAASISSNSDVNQINEISSSFNSSDKMPVETASLDNIEHPLNNSKSEVSPLWPKPRRSYRASLSNLPVRSSPRLKKMVRNQTLDEKLLSEEGLYYKGTSLNIKQGLPSKQKLEGRKLLSRNVEESKTLKTVEEELALQEKGGLKNVLSISYSKHTTNELVQSSTNITSIDLPKHSEIDFIERTPSPENNELLDDQSTTISDRLQTPKRTLVSRRVSTPNRTTRRISPQNASFNKLLDDQNTTTLDHLTFSRDTSVSGRASMLKSTTHRISPQKTLFNELDDQNTATLKRLPSPKRTPLLRGASTSKRTSTRKSPQKTSFSELLDAQGMVTSDRSPYPPLVSRCASTPERTTPKISPQKTSFSELLDVDNTETSDRSPSPKRMPVLRSATTPKKTTPTIFPQKTSFSELLDAQRMVTSDRSPSLTLVSRHASTPKKTTLRISPEKTSIGKLLDAQNTTPLDSLPSPKRTLVARRVSTPKRSPFPISSRAPISKTSVTKTSFEHAETFQNQSSFEQTLPQRSIAKENTPLLEKTHPKHTIISDKELSPIRERYVTQQPTSREPSMEVSMLCTPTSSIVKGVYVVSTQDTAGTETSKRSQSCLSSSRRLFDEIRVESQNISVNQMSSIKDVGLLPSKKGESVECQDITETLCTSSNGQTQTPGLFIEAPTPSLFIFKAEQSSSAMQDLSKKLSDDEVFLLRNSSSYKKQSSISPKSKISEHAATVGRKHTPTSKRGTSPFRSRYLTRLSSSRELTAAATQNQEVEPVNETLPFNKGLELPSKTFSSTEQPLFESRAIAEEFSDPLKTSKPESPVETLYAPQLSTPKQLHITTLKGDCITIEAIETPTKEAYSEKDVDCENKILSLDPNTVSLKLTEVASVESAKLTSEAVPTLITFTPIEEEASFVKDVESPKEILSLIQNKSLKLTEGRNVEDDLITIKVVPTLIMSAPTEEAVSFVKDIDSQKKMLSLYEKKSLKVTEIGNTEGDKITVESTQASDDVPKEKASYLENTEISLSQNMSLNRTEISNVDDKITIETNQTSSVMISAAEEEAYVKDIESHKEISSLDHNMPLKVTEVDKLSELSQPIIENKSDETIKKEELLLGISNFEVDASKKRGQAHLLLHSMCENYSNETYEERQKITQKLAFDLHAKILLSQAVNIESIDDSSAKNEQSLSRPEGFVVQNETPNKQQVSVPKPALVPTDDMQAIDEFTEKPESVVGASPHQSPFSEEFLSVNENRDSLTTTSDNAFLEESVQLELPTEKDTSLGENLSFENMPLVLDLNTAHIEVSNEISIVPSLSDSSITQFEDSENPLNATVINTCLLEDSVVGIEETETEASKTVLMDDAEGVLVIQNADDVYTENMAGISDNSSSSVNMVPVDLEMNIFEVPDDLSTVSTEYLPDPLQKIELDSNYNANSDDEYAKSILFSEVQDSSMESLDTINEELSEPCSSSKNTQIIASDTNLSILKTPIKGRKRSNSFHDKEVFQDVTPITRSRSKSISAIATPNKIEKELPELCSSNKNTQIIANDTNLPILKMPVKGRKRSNSVCDNEVSQDVTPITRSRSKSITAIATANSIDISESSLETPKSFKRDIFEVTPPTTPFTQISVDELEKSEYMNRTSLGMKLNLTDIFDKTPTTDDENNEERIFKINVAKAKTPLRRSRRLSTSSLNKRDGLASPSPSKAYRALSDTSPNTTQVPAKRRRSKSTEVMPKLIVPLDKPEPVVAKSEDGLKEKKLRSMKKSKSATVPVDTKSDYTSSRRLTRKQASLIEKTLDSLKVNASSATLNYDSTDSDDCNRGPDVEVIDPINLLDKANFEGKPDPDEQNLIQKSPASSVSGSIVSLSTRKLRSRSSSLASKVSAYSETTSKKMQPTCEASDQIEGISSRLRQRSKSVDDAMYSGLSPKLRKLQTKAKDRNWSGGKVGSIGIAHRTRSKSVDQPVQRNTRQQLLKLELSEIPESDESPDEKLTKKLRSRK